MQIHRVLMVEDDPRVVELVSANARPFGFEFSVASDASSALSLFDAKGFSLVILDLSFPGGDGLDLCRKFRQEAPALPILILTSRGEEIDRILGLEIGADDYVTKPFSGRELVARMKALLRRAAPETLPAAGNTVDAPSKFVSGGLEIDLENRTVHREGRRIDLTGTEYGLLSLLLSQPGRNFTRYEIIEAVWGEYFPNIENSLNRHLSRLRSKVEANPANPEFVITVPTIGYRWGR